MICADSSSVIAFLNGKAGQDRAKLRAAIVDGKLALAPIVVTEILSFPQGVDDIRRFIIELPTLQLTPGYWERAGDNRRLILSKGLKARTADALVAQAAIDAGAPLIARDTDFRHFADFCGLKLA